MLTATKIPVLLLSPFSFLITGMQMLFLPPLPKETLIPIVSRNISCSQEELMSNTANYSAMEAKSQILRLILY